RATLTGTSFMPSSSAALYMACPARITPRSSTTIALRNPNSRMDAATAPTAASLTRACPSYGLIQPTRRVSTPTAGLPCVLLGGQSREPADAGFPGPAFRFRLVVMSRDPPARGRRPTGASPSRAVGGLDCPEPSGSVELIGGVPPGPGLVRGEP